MYSPLSLAATSLQLRATRVRVLLPKEVQERYVDLVGEVARL